MKLKEEFLVEFLVTDEEEAEKLAKKLIHLDYESLHQIVIQEMCDKLDITNPDDVSDSEWNDNYFEGYNGVAEMLGIKRGIIEKLYEETDWDIWEDDTGVDEKEAVRFWDNVFTWWNNAYSLRFVSEHKRTVGICVAAVKHNKGALEFVPKSLLKQVKVAVDNYYQADKMNDTAVDYFNEQNYSKAVEAISKAIELAPDDATYWENRAEFYEAMGEQENAIADCEKALELDPNKYTAKEILERYQKVVVPKKNVPAAKVPPSFDNAAAPGFCKEDFYGTWVPKDGSSTETFYPDDTYEFKMSDLHFKAACKSFKFYDDSGVDDYPIRVIFEYTVIDIFKGDRYKIGDEYSVLLCVNEEDKTVLYVEDAEIILKKQKDKPAPAPKKPAAPVEKQPIAKPAPAAKTPPSPPPVQPAPPPVKKEAPPPVQEATGAVCPKCGKVARVGAKFCSACGTKFAPVCANCGRQLKATSKFCPGCGTKVEQ